MCVGIGSTGNTVGLFELGIELGDLFQPPRYSLTRAASFAGARSCAFTVLAGAAEAATGGDIYFAFFVSLA